MGLGALGSLATTLPAFLSRIQKDSASQEMSPESSPEDSQREGKDPSEALKAPLHGS